MKLNYSQKSAVWSMTIWAAYTTEATCVTKLRLNLLRQFSMHYIADYFRFIYLLHLILFR